MAITFIPCGHWIYLLTSRLDFVTFSRTHPVNRPCIRFLFVGSGLCRRLPSHKHSHACTCLELVVLPLGSTAPTVDFHHLVIAHAGQTKNNNVITTSQVLQLGFSKTLLTNYVHAGLLERRGPGIYTLPGKLHDDMHALMLRSSKIIFSHDSALFLNGQSERTPFRHIVTIPSDSVLPASLKNSCTCF